MSDPTSDNDRFIANAETWCGRSVCISSSGRGGWVTLTEKSHNAQVTTTCNYGGSRQSFHIESVPDMPGVVTFRVEGTADLYLTNIMYGDQHRQNAAGALASIPGLLAEHIGMVVDFAVGRPTDESNFEGAGFNYSPMVAQRGPSSKLQMFRLEGRGRHLGVKSLFGTYWRCQWWNQTVSQSPHMLGDETWCFYNAEDINNRDEDTHDDDDSSSAGWDSNDEAYEDAYWSEEEESKEEESEEEESEDEESEGGGSMEE
ncbi:expressed unknown protein [Seminavis robusta]|uniref:Uncharacterized protein n=1 Tax=Seminavis robusta TaxID=568900 RepID=A0A9N8H6W8_9STRA|nr:expressed unknown protein [Seminavis robusta]|eukprot:Sro160_g072130.1 n/a (258) ;mRNA; f:42940-43713